MYIYKIAKSQKREWIQPSGTRRYPRTPDCVVVGHETKYTKEQLRKVCAEALVECMPELLQDYLSRLGDYVMGKLSYEPSKAVWPEAIVPILCKHLIKTRGFVELIKAEEVAFGFSIEFSTDTTKQGKMPSVKYLSKYLGWFLQKAWIDRELSIKESE